MFNHKLWRYFGLWILAVLHLGLGLITEFSQCKFFTRTERCVCVYARMCARVGRMAGILIPLSSLACTCGANVSTGFWRDNLALHFSPCGERLACHSPPAPSDT